MFWGFHGVSTFCQERAALVPRSIATGSRLRDFRGLVLRAARF